MTYTADSTVAPHGPPATAAYSRKNPFPGRMLVNRRLNSPDSEKDTRHFEISVEGSGISYEVGDSMAVYPTNDPGLVDEILAALGAKGDEEIAGSRGAMTLREGLIRDYSVTQPTPRFLTAIAERASAAPLLIELLDPERKHDLDTYLWGMEMIDFLIEHPSVKFTPQEFVALTLSAHPLVKTDSSHRAEMILPVLAITDGSRRAIAVWITRRGEMSPIQATGGWLN